MLITSIKAAFSKLLAGSLAAAPDPPAVMVPEEAESNTVSEEDELAAWVNCCVYVHLNGFRDSLVEVVGVV